MYKKDEAGLVVPTQGYEGDVAHDLYASEGAIIPPLTFQSVAIKTSLKTAFEPTVAGMYLALRSGVALRTPLVMSNAPGIIEGTYRNGINILVRNTFIDNSLVDFVITTEGKRLPLAKVPHQVLKTARKFYEAETELLGYEGLDSVSQKNAFIKLVPRGTVYVARHERIAQMFFLEKIHPELKGMTSLPDSVRGENGLGSSGTHKK